jgi:heterodisulfide reductase subunit C2
MSNAHAATHDPSLAGQIRQDTGESVADCYQCGKCSGGCPLADEMDFPPSQVLRLLQLGFPELDREVLGSLAIWLCLTCETCVTRCPKEVDLPRIMEHLREESRERGLVNPKAKDILAFHEAFLDQVKMTGRLFEVGLISEYKLKTLHLFQDVLVAPKLLKRGKLGFFPHKIADRAAVKRIFEKTMQSHSERSEESSHGE